MKLKKISTEQFAGIRDKELSFANGVNVIYGKNESGKTTLVNLISGILFKNAKIDGRRDRDFKESAFPAERKDGKRFGSIDGTAVIEAADGDYKLTKEWGDDAVSKLSTPDGIIKKQEQINEVLSEILGYGEGVYREMLLSPQSSAAENLKNILDRKDTETRRTLAETISEAFAESDGISADVLEKKINEKIDALSANWDISSAAPKKKSGGGRWVKGVGTVLKALYDWEDAEEEFNELKDLEDGFDKSLSEFSAAEAAAAKADGELEEFDKYYDAIRALKSNNDIITRCNNDIRRFYKALEDFPKATDDLKKAQELKEEKENRELLDRYISAKKISNELQKIESELNGISCPKDGEISELRSAEREMLSLKNELRGMNIDARIKMLGDNSVKITSLVSGSEIALDGENARINEAVLVEIPGVMEMELSPSEVNAAVINSRIAELENIILEIFKKYGCKSSEEIAGLADKYNKLANSKTLAESSLRAAAGDDFAELESRAGTLTGVRGKPEIDGDIAALCKGGDINGFIGAKSSELTRFTDEFGNEDELKKRIAECFEELKRAQNAVSAAESIPEKYRSISDPESSKNSLKAVAETARRQKEDKLSDKAAAQNALDRFTESHDDDLHEKCERVKRNYEAQAALLDRWIHIRDVFNAKREEVTANPLESLADSFVKYLGQISGDRVTAEFAEAGKPDFKVSSGNYDLDFVKLSDGTKETVYLAFRLAVLDHLFPDGGGVIVLDDPLNDMDIDRVKQSCELIKESAKRHQIIFLTCREEYAALLEGNEIRI